MRAVVQHPSYCLQFLQSGRLVHIKYQDYDFGWGAVVNFLERRPGKGQKNEDFQPQESYIVDVLLPVASDVSVGTRTHTDLPDGIRPPPVGDKGKMEVIPVLLSCIVAIGHVRIFLPKNLYSKDDRTTVRKSLEEVQKRFPDGVAILDPIENMGITDNSFKKLLRKIEVLESRLLANPLHNSPRLESLYNQYSAKKDLDKQIKNVRKEIQDALTIKQLDELKNRKRVLRRLGFVNEDDVVQLKARVACEISTGDELVLSELLFNRFFNELTPEECASVLSCFIFEEKTKEVPQIRESLTKAHREIVAQARIVAQVSMESKLAVDEDAYLKSFQPELMEVVFAWCNGQTFAEIWSVFVFPFTY
jgi:ATP-dependent RNA helicase DOB1